MSIALIHNYQLGQSEDVKMAVSLKLILHAPLKNTSENVMLKIGQDKLIPNEYTV